MGLEDDNSNEIAFIATVGETEILHPQEFGLAQIMLTLMYTN